MKRLLAMAAAALCAALFVSRPTEVKADKVYHFAKTSGQIIIPDDRRVPTSKNTDKAKVRSNRDQPKQ
jgi:hypothetical protein